MILPALEPTQWATIATLADTIWTEHYTPIIGREQVDYMVSHFQSAEAISQQVQEQHFAYYVIQPAAEPIGYLAVQVRGSELFLSKLYLLAQERGRGYAKVALAFVEQMAREQDLEKITLTVNKNNTATIAVYQKMGFEIVTAVVQDIGHGYVMDDYLMKKQI